MKHFTVTEGKGVRIGFPNGWSVSIQWGPGNYCDNYHRMFSGSLDMDSVNEEKQKAGKDGSTTAEVAVFNDEGDFMDLPNGDQVHGYCTPGKVLEYLYYAQMGQVPPETLDK